MTRRSCNKLARRYYGLFKIVERISKVAYMSNLPAGSKIHPVFHISLLNEYKGGIPLVSPFFLKD